MTAPVPAAPPAPSPGGPAVATSWVSASTRVFLRPTAITIALGVLALGAAAFWWGTETEAQLTIAAGLLTAVVVDALTARSALRTVTLQLHGPPEARAGEPMGWVLRASGLRRPIALAPALWPRPPRTLVDREAPGLLRLPPFSRGLVHQVVIDATVTGPIGLFEAGRRYRVHPDIPVNVGPQPAPFDPEWPRPRAVGFGSNEVAPIGDDLFRSIRPYQRGDERRRIHWKASAHHGELMVRESDGTGIIALQITVDLGPPGAIAEQVASSAAHLAALAVGRGWVVQLVTLDARPDAPPPMPLGTPFGAPPVTGLAAQVPVVTLAQKVGSTQAISRQLATAAFGAPMPPPWSGLTCTIGPEGLTWT